MRLARRILHDFFEIGIIQDVPSPSYDPVSFEINSNVNGFTMRVLSMNIWGTLPCWFALMFDQHASLVGLPVAPLVEERIEAITHVFKDEWDVIVFQEVWHQRERNQLIQCGVQAGYYAYHYFKAAVGFPLPLGHKAFSTGLLVLARP